MPESHSIEFCAPKPRNMANRDVRRPSRREILCWTVASSAAAGLTAASMVQADDLEATGDSGDDGYSRYCAVPRDEDQFTQAVRIERNVMGPKFLGGGMGRTGYEAWLNAEEANELRQRDDILAVQQLTDEDVPVLGDPLTCNWQIRILLAPNGWFHKPAGDTYQSSQELSTHWTEQFATPFYQTSAAQEVIATLGSEEASTPIIAELREHPQVVGLLWMSVFGAALFQPPGGFPPGGFPCVGCGLG